MKLSIIALLAVVSGNVAAQQVANSTTTEVTLDANSGLSKSGDLTVLPSTSETGLSTDDLSKTGSLSGKETNSTASSTKNLDDMSGMSMTSTDDSTDSTSTGSDSSTSTTDSGNSTSTDSANKSGSGTLALSLSALTVAVVLSVAMSL